MPKSSRKANFPSDELLEEILPNDHSRQSSAFQLAREILSQSNSFRTVLDLCCGLADSKESFSQLDVNLRWFGIDLLSSPEVDRRRLVEKICAYDGVHLPFPTACFDLVYSRQVLDHVLDPIHLIHEVSRIIKPTGFFVGSVSYLEQYHSYSTWNWTPYGLYKCLDANGFDLLTLRPGIDGLTLAIRAQGLRGSFCDRFFENESPLNVIIGGIGRIRKKRHCAINAFKLRFAGHICFVARSSRVDVERFHS